MNTLKYLSLEFDTTNQSGFTLIELMIVISMIAILSVIAIPSYRQYLQTNQESVATSDILQLSGQLEQWRTKYLTYKNFTPKAGYSVKATNEITSPIGKDVDDAKYNIQIKTFINDAVSNITEATASNNWILIATPIDTDSDLNHYAMTSSGTQCLNKSTIDAVVLWTDGNCGTGGENW